jgi:phosphohistidine phosphatase SixA
MRRLANGRPSETTQEIASAKYLMVSPQRRRQNEMMRFALLLLLPALAACAPATVETMNGSASTPVAQPVTTQPSRYVMRHLQRGAGDDPALTEEGRRNAERLIDFFADDPPSAIFVSDTRRARETAAPLAARLGLAVAEYKALDAAGVAERAAQQGGTVLIVGHSNTVPAIVEALGGTAPPMLDDAAFGDVWHVSGADRRTDKLRVVP